jgi:hypothetical protein
MIRDVVSWSASGLFRFHVLWTWLKQDDLKGFKINWPIERQHLHTPGLDSRSTIRLSIFHMLYRYIVLTCEGVAAWVGMCYGTSNSNSCKKEIMTSQCPFECTLGRQTWLLLSVKTYKFCYEKISLIVTLTLTFNPLTAKFRVRHFNSNVTLLTVSF